MGKRILPIVGTFTVACLSGCASTHGVAQKVKLPAGTLTNDAKLSAPADVDTVLRPPGATSTVTMETKESDVPLQRTEDDFRLASGIEPVPIDSRGATVPRSSSAVPRANEDLVSVASRPLSQRTRELASRVQKESPDRLAEFMQEVRKGAVQGTLADVLESWEVSLEFDYPRPLPPSVESLSGSFREPSGRNTASQVFLRRENPKPTETVKSPELPPKSSDSESTANQVSSVSSVSEGVEDRNLVENQQTSKGESGRRRIPFREIAEGKSPKEADNRPTSTRTRHETVTQWAAELEKMSFEDPSNQARWQVASRLLRAAAGDVEGAVEPVTAADGSDRRFWRTYAHAAVRYLDEQSYSRAGQRATDAAVSLRDSLSALAEKADLEISEPIFCRSVQSFGNYDEFPKDEFRAGEGVVVYWQVKNFASVESPEGFRTKMQAEFEILDSTGARRRQFQQKFKDDVCRNRRTDYFNVVVFEWPKDLPPGEYTFKTTVTDLTSQKTCERQRRFRIVP